VEKVFIVQALKFSQILSMLLTTQIHILCTHPVYICTYIYTFRYDSWF
jgi:hypothetical protein